MPVQKEAIRSVKEEYSMIFKDRFKDKVMILTGAARGIGRTTAIRAAQEGAKMVLADRLAEEGEAKAFSFRWIFLKKKTPESWWRRLLIPTAAWILP